MKIAIAAPCPQPFVIGGAEKLWWGLARYINESTAHQADIIKLPVDERDFWSLLSGYERFARLDLSGFDAVISGKYPAWMVRHPQHVLYMLHPARGLYEGYTGPALAAEEAQFGPAWRQFVTLLQRRAPQRDHVAEVFARLAELREGDRREGRAPPAWPGPLAREVIRWLDAAAWRVGEIRSYAAIAQGLTVRPGYFAPGCDVAVAHPPTELQITPGERFGYVLSVSRLEAYKRVDLVIEAFRQVSGDVELRIAGTGPEEARLRTLAAADTRIRFLGHVSDAELVALYRDALVVPFAPYQEDYGLISVEAMMAGKAVITTSDAGGPTELVCDGENGYVVAPDAPAIATALQRLVDDPALARRLGEAARRSAERITWANVLACVLPSAAGEGVRTGGEGARASGNVGGLVDPALKFRDIAERRECRNALGIESPLVLVHGASGVAAAAESTAASLQDLCALARELPAVAFAIPDVVIDEVDRASSPPNLWWAGTPSITTRAILHDVADVALFLSPLDQGAVRMARECFARGLPVVTSGMASSWLTGLNDAHLRIAAPAMMAATIGALLADPAGAQAMTRAARALLDESVQRDGRPASGVSDVAATETPR